MRRRPRLQHVLQEDPLIARTLAAALAAASVVTGARPASASSHPPGVTYPLRPAARQPAGLAQPLPSTRRYVLVWKDQLADAVESISPSQKDFIVTHYVGTQKLFAHQIDEYRQKNPNFLTLTYHLAYGLNGADQANPVSNIVGPEKYGQEDTEAFTPYVAAHSLEREKAYQHTSQPGTTANRVSYPDPYWLMDISSVEWRSYLFDTLVAWQAFPATKATGVFLDVAFPPWLNYSPDGWWSTVAGGSSRAALRDFWNPRARDYFDAMRAAFAASASHPRYLVIPNTDALVDSTDEPAFLDGTDGVFTENWQTWLGSAGDENLSLRRIEKYATSQGKVWMADVTKAGTDLAQAEREQLLGAYLLIRNGTSYVMLGNSDVTWYPEYEVDLGAYEEEPPEDLEALRVAGVGGSEGGLYLRRYVAGMVLVNTSSASLSYPLPAAMKRAAFSGGGPVGTDGTLPAFTLTYDTDVPAGVLAVAAHSVALLRVPSGAPLPGAEPSADRDGGTSGDAASAAGASNAAGGGTGAGGSRADGGAGSGGKAGATGSAGGSSSTAPGGGHVVDAGLAGTDAGTMRAASSSSGCDCRITKRESATSRSGLVALGALALLRRRRQRRASVL
ncbi:MAG TPA: putative glycoside hydrolase [Polyangiaceae bacterium]|jgi:hypothetical protein|nr:putative glycoside hydrolase [Polyangiaceae bacterium]